MSRAVLDKAAPTGPVRRVRETAWAALKEEVAPHQQTIRNVDMHGTKHMRRFMASGAASKMSRRIAEEKSKLEAARALKGSS